MSTRLHGLLAASLLFLMACSDTSTPAPSAEPLEVGTVELAAERIVVSSDLPGRVESTRVAEVRARVPGVVLERNFREGSEVKAGQVLFRIDPAPLEADVQQARANLEQAEATLYEAKLLEERHASLVAKRAVSKQEYDRAVAGHRKAAAGVAQARAALERAQLDLGYATVEAPISGRIGRALVTEGALVGQGEVTPLATIQTLDPVYVNVTQSTNDLLRLRSALDQGGVDPLGSKAAAVTIHLGNGQPYAETGKLLFSDITVDPSTGQVTLRALIPNPQGILLPGMYVRAAVQQGVREQAVAVPAQAIQRDSNGTASVMVIGDNETAQRRVVTTGPMADERWIIESGLEPGDIVIVDRLQQIERGMKVTSVPWRAHHHTDIVSIRRQ